MPRAVGSRVLWITLGTAVAVLAVSQLIRRVGNPAEGGPAERLSEFLGQVQEAAAEREVELRAALGMDGRHDVVDMHTADNRSGDRGTVGENR